MESNTTNEYFDFDSPNSLLKMVERDPETDQFPMKCIAKTAISHDVYQFTFEFPNKDWICGCWPAGHIRIWQTIGDK